MGRRWVTTGVATILTSAAIAVGLWLTRSPASGRGLPAPRPIDVSTVDPVLHDLVGYCNALPESAHPTLSLRPVRAARARLDAQSETGSPSPALLLNVAQELAKAGDIDGALDLIERAADHTSDDAAGNAVVHFGRAAVHLRAAGLGSCKADGDPTGCLLGRASNDGERDHAEAAVRSLEVVLALRPDDSAARWLINMAHGRMGSYPGGVPIRWLIPTQAFGGAADAPAFVDVARDVGLAAVNLLGGSIMDDFDNDGFLDIFTTSYDPCTSAIFYRNNGDGTFTDLSSSAGLTHQFGGFNAVQTDYDNDGYLDVFVLRGAWQFAYGRQRNSLLRNNGDGTFVDVTQESGLADPSYPTQAGAWADYDQDGDLDLYVGNEAENQQVHYPNQLFRNNGDGTFTDVAPQAGVTNDGMTKGVAWGDYDNDGDPDLYVSNIGPNSLYRNNGDGTFTDVAVRLRVDEPVDRSFVPWFWDYDNDGWLDLYVAGYSVTLANIALDYLGSPAQGVRPRLYRNNGRGGFEDVTEAVGLAELQLPMGANFGDIDNDGWLDIYLGTGDPPLETVVPNVMYRNVEGQTFVDVTLAAGVGHLEKGHGIAFGDIDNDGDQDIYLQAGGFARSDVAPNALFRNPGNANHWIAIRLIGEVSNRAAIGARLKLVVRDGGTTRTIYATVSSGGSFGASSLLQEMGIGAATVIEELEVVWPTSGTRQVFRQVAVDRFIEINESADSILVTVRKSFRLGN